jgi:hypothetical protein
MTMKISMTMETTALGFLADNAAESSIQKPFRSMRKFARKFSARKERNSI